MNATVMERRSFIAAGLFATVAVGATIPTLAANPASAWATAMQAFEARRAEEDAYHRAAWRPAYHASKAGGPNIPDHVDAEMERLVDARCDAEDTLIATPAPALSAVIWKMEYAQKCWEDFDGWPDDWWTAVMSDLHRLAAGGDPCLSPAPTSAALGTVPTTREGMLTYLDFVQSPSGWASFSMAEDGVRSLCATFRAFVTMEARHAD